MQLERGTIYRTPNGGYDDRTVDVHPMEMQVVELPDRVLEVHDPLFEAPYRIGDQSLITDPTADDYVVAHWEHHGLHGSTRQLSNTEVYETKTGTGRWSRMQHMLSSAAITAYFGGRPLEIMQMATHDSAHRKGSHRTDDLLDGRGPENSHDGALAAFLKRGGFVNRLQSEGLIDEAGYFKGIDAHIDQVIDLSHLPKGLINWPGKTGNLEAERLQYLLHELGIWVYDPETVREIMSHIYRDPDSPEGDQLLFDDPEAAALLTKGQIRCFTEHWSEKGNDITDELLATIDRFILTSNEEACSPYNDYFPGDALYTLEEDWQGLVDDMTTSQGKAFVAGMSKIVNALCRQQKNVHSDYDNSGNPYRGPVLPEWMTIQESLLRSSDHQQRTIHQKKKGISTDLLILEMKQGKPRAIDPWVKLPGRDMRRVSDLVPSVREFRADQTRWCDETYDAIIDLTHSSLNLTPSEIRAIREGLEASHEKWPEALRRPAMPDELLERRIAHAGERYRRLGSFTASREVIVRAS